jgi:sensor histidine kinase YesM
MKHPILGSIATAYYFLIWVLIGFVHFYVLYAHLDLPWLFSLQNTIVFNFTFACLGLGLWYLVRFSIPTDLSDSKPLLTLSGTGIITLLLWTFICTSIIQLIQPNEVYQQLLDEALLYHIISGAFYYIVIVLVYYLILYNQNLQEQKNRQLQLATEVKDAELRMLKSQINPHFIFNSLNSINSLTISDPPKARQMIINLSSFLRYSIGKDNKETTNLGTELENIELYLAIEKVRFGDRLVFNNQVSPACHSSKIPNLLLQPLFENAIKHGIQESIDTITINLDATLTETMLSIKISNNFDPESVPQKGQGIGLKNIKQRLNLIYGQEGLIQQKVKDNIFEITLEIPQ